MIRKILIVGTIGLAAGFIGGFIEGMLEVDETKTPETKKKIKIAKEAVTTGVIAGACAIL